LVRNGDVTLVSKYEPALRPVNTNGVETTPISFVPVTVNVSTCVTVPPRPSLTCTV
jgi:hypothetical protein